MVARLLLVWFSVSAVVSPLVGMMLANQGERVAPARRLQLVRTAPSSSAKAA